MRTVRIKASIRINLYRDINIPVDVTEDELSELIGAYDLLSESDMGQHLFNNGRDFSWEGESDIIEFDPKAPDLTGQITAILNNKNK